MQCELLSADGDVRQLAAELRALVPGAESVRDAVADIIARVRADGDSAILELTRQLDTAGAEPKPLRVDPEELAAAARALDPALRIALEQASANVGTVAHATIALDEDAVVTFDTHEVRLRHAPVQRAAIYVPGGRAPYPSSVVMGVASARAAGVSEIAVCCPPGEAGEIDAVVLGACELTGADRVFRMGGAQAIAALAYGSESVGGVDVIAGPGNLYVQEAKRQVSGQVGIEGFAGPSDLVVIAYGNVDVDALALDLLAQAEHGAGTLVVAISTDAPLLAELARKIEAAPDTGAVARLIEVARLDRALELAEALAPEHLQLVGPHAEGLAPAITRAGCLFVGAGAGTAFGDYIAGSNHVLPTGGAARFASALSPAHFRRSFSEVRIDDPGALARAAASLARAEGFEFHARSMEARIRDNGA